MDSVLLVARVLLAAVFAAAGLAKLADRAGSRRALVDFGVPTAAAAWLGPLLPLAELAVAVALLPTATAWWGALGALALLSVFVAAIGISLARGRTPDCRCFGQLSAGPVGPSTLVRNAVLAAAAGFVVWRGQADPGPSVVGWLGAVTTAERASLVIGVVGLGLLAAMAWILAQVLGQQGRLLLRLDELEERLAGSALPSPSRPGLPVGASAPAFRLPGLDGEGLALEGLRAAGKPVLLLFTDPACTPCAALLPDVGRWQRDHAAHLTIAVISRGTPEANRAKAAEHGVAPVLLQRGHEIAEAYQAHETPSAVLVRPDGTIGSSVARGPAAIRSVVAHMLGAVGGQPGAMPAPLATADGHDHGHGHDHDHDAAMPAPVKIGEPAPGLELPDLDGKPVALADFRGSTTLVLFWNPGCGFCQRMLPDLKAWETDPTKGALRLLVVSAGSVEDNRTMGLRSPVVLDQGFATGVAFGATGTPSAVLVDAKGKVTSDLAAGADAIRALVGTGPGKARVAHA